ncbi:MAG: hypothetical protein DGJ47_000623 [Rickettsiaceae bacterium]
MVSNPILKAKLMVFIIITAVVITTANLISGYLFLSSPLKEEKLIVIKKGSSVKQISRLLEQESVIRDRWLFKIIGGLYDIKHPFKSGEYRFTPGITPYQVLITLSHGKSVLRRLYIPEGSTSKQIIEIVNDNERLIGSFEQSVPEGHLMPSTYFYSYGDRKKTMISLMLRKMSENLDKAIEVMSKDSPIKSRKELLILASIIEKEAGNNHEKPIIASVFLNRLRKNMKLQADPTVIYSLTKGQFKLNRKLTRKDLKIPSPYNTYYIDALPIGPICSPSYSSIMAVARPAKTKYLYFVANGKGTHSFATNLRQHNNNVASFKSYLKARRNKKVRNQ